MSIINILNNKILYLLIAFVLGWLVSRQMGNGFSVGGGKCLQCGCGACCRNSNNTYETIKGGACDHNYGGYPDSPKCDNWCKNNGKLICESSPSARDQVSSCPAGN